VLQTSCITVLQVNQERTGYFNTKSPLGSEIHHYRNAKAVRRSGEEAMTGGWESGISSGFAENVSWETWADLTACSLCKAMLKINQEIGLFRA